MTDDLYPEPSDRIEEALDEFAAVKDLEERRSYREQVRHRYDREMPGTGFRYDDCAGEIKLFWEDPWEPGAEDRGTILEGPVTVSPDASGPVPSGAYEELREELERYETDYMTVNGPDQEALPFPTVVMTIAIPKDFDRDEVWETGKRAYEAAVRAEAAGSSDPSGPDGARGLYARFRDRFL